MAKKSRKRPARFEKYQSGCIWSLINIFDFRHARFSQKLLPDRKRGGKRVIGAGYAEITLESLSDSCEIFKDTDAGIQSQMSVKELMEEEMFGEQDQKKGASIDKRDMRSKIDLDADDFVLVEDLVVEKPSHRKNEPSGSVDLNVMVEELCSRIHHKDVSHLERGQDGELATQPIEDPSLMEEKLCEATKVLVNHFTHEKSFNKDEKVESSSRELMNALQILNSNKEAFLKFLKDPNSLLVKQIQGLQDVQVEEGKFKVLTGSELLEQQHIGDDKQQNYFWRKFKGLDRNSSRKNETSEDLNKIVVLKPGPLGSRNLDVAPSCGSFPGSPQSIQDKGQIQRTSSPFSFSELKRKLKHAMKKDHQGLIFIHNGMSRQSSNEALKTNRDKKIGGESVAMASPSRDHFFIERIPKSTPGLKKVDKILLEHDTDLPPEQRVSNIYVEAKKHLAEIVGNGDVDLDTRSKPVPKALGRILSFSGYTSPTVCSPRTDGSMRLSLDRECQTRNDKTCQVIKQTSPSLPAKVRQESENSDKPFHEAETPSLVVPCFSEELPSESSVDNPTHEAEICASEVGADIVRSSDADSPEESNLIEISFKSCAMPSSIGEQVETSSKCLEDKHFSACLEKDICDESEVLSSQTTSTPSCSVSEMIKDPDVTSDATSKPSPVSVLEPLFKEDDISPPGIKSFTVVESFQPRQIHFETDISLSLEQVPYNRNSKDDNKYSFEFVKDVVQMSGLTWDELLNRSLFLDHLVDPDLIDEVDFLPDLLPCDFNLLFYLINEVLLEIFRVNLGCMLSFAKPFMQPESTGKDIFSETWKGVDWYLKLDGGPPCTLDQLVAKDFGKSRVWMDLQLDSESIGIQVQEVILEELMEELLQAKENPILTSVEAQESEVSIELL